MTSHRRVHTKYAWDRKFTDHANENQVARLNHITNDFYKHHRLYRILGVERHTRQEDIAAKGKSKMGGLDPASQQYKDLENATKLLTNWRSREFYDREGDWDPRTESCAPESRQDAWDRMREPENLWRHGEVTYSKKELDILASMKHEHGAASGKLSTHNQFGSASTWNPYFI